ncbi:MAG: hypothetical protein AB1597_06190 [Chloroflexota bacterium]
MKRITWVAISIAVLILLLIPLTACSSPAPAAPATLPTTSAPPAASKPGALTLDVTPVLDGVADKETTVTATTAPGAKVTIQVTNPKTGTKSSYPKDKERVADANGKVVWTWTIHRQVAKGDGTISVTAELGGEKVIKEVLFRVVQSDY